MSTEPIKVITKNQLLLILPELDLSVRVLLQPYSRDIEDVFRLAALYIGTFALAMLVISMYFH